MMYLTKEELVKNIAEQTERAFAVIEHMDFSSDKLNPNAVIIPFLCNIADYALIVTALEDDANSENDCHRNALSLVMESPKIKNTTKNFIRKIQKLRRKYTLDGANVVFNSDECLDFLNAYDCFMFEFIKNSTTVQETGCIKFASFRNVVDRLIRKSTADTDGNSDSELLKQIMKNNSLLEELIAENHRINSRLDDIIKLIDNGGKL